MASPAGAIGTCKEGMSANGEIGGPYIGHVDLPPSRGWEVVPGSIQKVLRSKKVLEWRRRVGMAAKGRNTALQGRLKFTTAVAPTARGKPSSASQEIVSGNGR